MTCGNDIAREAIIMYKTSDLIKRGCGGLLAAVLSVSLAGCGSPAASDAASRQTFVVSEASAEQAESGQLVEDGTTTDGAEAVMATVTSSAGGKLDAASLFTERDLNQVADLTGASTIILTSGEDVTITAEGVYVISGEATDATIIVEADDSAKVQLVLDGVSVTNSDAPAIYVRSADKVFVTTAEETTNLLQVTGTFVADGETNTDAVIFSKDDLVLNGLGTLQLSSTANGVSSKDDLKVTGGSYVVDTTADAFEANDSIAICDGSFSITSGKDGLHAENDEDDTVGSICICGGSFEIDAASDAIQATTVLQIDGGSFALSAGEALEGTYVQVNGGDIDISASDDGINGTSKSASFGVPTVEIRGGTLSISMAAGDTDAIDVNGDLIVSGGEITISAQFAFDFDGSVSFTGGTVTVNGEQLSEITNSMMGGGMGGMGPMGGGMPREDMGGFRG